MPRYYPAALLVEGRRCVVVGGGGVAARRVEGLIEAGAHVVVVAPRIGAAVAALAQSGRIVWQSRAFDPECLAGAFLVVAATDNPAVNARVVEAARDAQALCNDAEEPGRGDFIVPSAVRRGDLLLMVTAGGLSPFLSARIRRELEGQYGPEYADYVALLGEVRSSLLERMPDTDARRATLRDLASDEVILDLIRAGRPDEARARAFSCIS